MTEWLKFLNVLYAPFVAMFIYLDLDKEAVVGLTILLLVDMVTGVWKTIALGQKPKSWRFANGLISKLVLLIVPFALAISAKAVHIDITIFIYATIDALILSELYSILANIYTIQTKKITEEFDVMSLILKRTRYFINTILKDED